MKQYAYFLLALLFTSFSIQKQVKNYENDLKEISASVIIGIHPKDFIVIEDAYDENSVAFAKYKPLYEAEGWDYLTISSYQKDKTKYTDEQKSYGMGYLEGYLTYKRIISHLKNTKSNYYQGKEMPESTSTFLKEHYQFLNKMCKEKGNEPYWIHIRSIMLQYEGLWNGFNSQANTIDKVSFLDFQILSGFGDLPELHYYKSPQSRPDYSKMTSEESATYIEDRLHCSSLIKVAPDFSDMWFGHNSWFSYNMMTRIFKEYRYQSNSGTEKSKVVTFSSYPGALSSVDDFYITSQDLYVTETTNAVFETKLYDQLNPQTVLSWMRVIVANRLSTTALEWVNIIKVYNSGTYNNQYQVLDLKLIDTDKKRISPGAFYILEQIPGYTEQYDMTDHLKKGYWPSYNVPYSPEIRKRSGFNDYLDKHPENRDRYEYNTCSRGNIFRRDQHKVINVDSYKNMMTYNDYKNDPLSKSNPGLTIAARRDLLTQDLVCNGAIDVKFASVNDVKNKSIKKIHIISGPTNQQEAFDWNTTQCYREKPYFIHEGQNTKWAFPWIEYQTNLFQ